MYKYMCMYCTSDVIVNTVSRHIHIYWSYNITLYYHYDIIQFIMGNNINT